MTRASTIRRPAVGLLLVLGLATGCAGPGAPAAGGPSGASASVAPTTASVSAVPQVWTELEGTGRIRHPAGWRVFRRPLGLTPGSHLVLEMGTATTNPCRWRTRGTVREGGCWWDRLPAGGVEITWATRLPTLGPDTVSRTWTGATGQCRGVGGARSLAATVTVPGAAAGQGRYVVTACLADPGSAEARRQVDAMLDSLRP